MAISVGGEEKRIGLALSGGGFRAAAFHLGVFRCLHERKLLDKIDLISGVSGGSIAAAFLAAGWSNLDATLDVFETYLLTRSIAVSAVLEGILDPFKTRTEELAASYDDDLFHGITLDALAKGPRLYLNATNLANGKRFFFVTGGNGDIVMRDWTLKAYDAKTVRVSRAVAASSSFPPIFPPLRLTEKEVPPTDEVKYVTLTDGGVYDNLGINPLVLDHRNDLDYAIVSDGGKPFANDSTPTESGLLVLPAMIQILMEQVRALELERLSLRFPEGSGRKALWFSIDAAAGDTPAQMADARNASAVGTNLKKLSRDELNLLTSHAGALLAARLTKYAPELCS